MDADKSTFLHSKQKLLQIYDRHPGIAVGLATCGLALYVVVHTWYQGHSLLLGISGFLPVSDALGYYRCATSLAAAGDFSHVLNAAEWCGRRVIYPAMLSTLMMIGGWRPYVTILLQAVLIGAAISAFSMAAARSVGRLAAAAAFVVLFFYAREYALSLFVTEVAGLSASLTGMALLMHYGTRNRRPILLLFGLGLASIGMTARAGALFILPLLVLWAWWMLYRDKHRVDIGASLAALFAMLAGPMLQWFVLKLADIDPGNTGGNFAATLYGLSTGSRDWSQAYRDYASLFRDAGEVQAFRQIYAIAAHKILAAPEIFIGSLWQAGAGFLKGLFAFGPLARWNALLSALFVAGCFACVRRWRDSIHGLVLVIVLGEILAAPLIVDSGGQRVFAASIGGRALMVGIGLQFILALVFRIPTKIGGSGNVTGTASIPRMPMVLAGLILGAVLLPITPIARVFRLPELPAHGCPAQTVEVVTRIDRESQSMAVVGRNDETSIVPLAVTSTTLLHDPHLSNMWYGPGFRNLQPGTLVIHAVQRLHDGFGGWHFIAWHGQPLDSGATYSLCVENSQEVQLGDFPFSTVRSATRIGDSN